MAERYVDISTFQGQINWTLYRTWSDMAAMKATEGTGFTDPRWPANKAGAEAAGVRLIPYHYCRPDLNTPQSEAEWFFKVVGNTPDLFLMLDDEQQTSASTAAWAYSWLSRCEELFGQTPTVYASTSFIEAHLQDSRLAHFPLILANWTFDPNARPACPPPWRNYIALQYTDRATNIPGIAGPVDADIFLGGLTMGVPQGWSDANGVLVAPNGVPVHDGFRNAVENDPHFDPANWPQEAEYNANPVQYHVADSGNGDRQAFRDTVYWWTPHYGVIVEKYPGLELDAAYKLIAAQQAEIATLKAQPPTPAPVDISALLTAINNIPDAIGQAAGQATAAAILEAKKL